MLGKEPVARDSECRSTSRRTTRLDAISPKHSEEHTNHGLVYAHGCRRLGAASRYGVGSISIYRASPTATVICNQRFVGTCPPSRALRASHLAVLIVGTGFLGRGQPTLPLVSRYPTGGVRRRRAGSTSLSHSLGGALLSALGWWLGLQPRAG